MCTYCIWEQYLVKAKYTDISNFNSAITFGIGHLVGSIEVGKVADLVAFNPAFFGSKPELILKGGIIVWGQMGKIARLFTISRY